MIQREGEDTWCIQRCWIDGARAIDHVSAEAIHRRRYHRLRCGVHDHPGGSDLAEASAQAIVAPPVVVRESARRKQEVDAVVRAVCYRWNGGGGF